MPSETYKKILLGVCSVLFTGICTVGIVYSGTNAAAEEDAAAIESMVFDGRRDIRELPGEKTCVSVIGDVDLDNMLRARRGNKVVVLNFFASWCAPCRVELPELARLHGRFSQDELSIIGISVDMDAEAIDRMAAEEEIPYPIYRDDGSIAVKLGIRSIPLTVIIDKNGDTARAHRGILIEADAVAAVHEALTR